MSRWMGTQFGAATSVSRSEPGRVNLTSTSPEIGIYAEVMAWILSYVLLAAGVIGGWYLLCVRANRNRAVRILHWIESALGGQGHVTGMTWITASEFEVPVRLSASVFRKSKLLVCMTPRELPLNWLIGRLSKRHSETLTFTADLDLKPSFVLQVQSMRWFARSRKDADPADGNWTFENNAPVVLTTRADWQNEVAGIVQCMLECEQREGLQLQFRKTSPHFRATVPLSAIEPAEQDSWQIFDMLRSIAAGASAKA